MLHILEAPDVATVALLPGRGALEAEAGLVHAGGVEKASSEPGGGESEKGTLRN